MNSVQLIGRLTAQPECRYTPSGKAVANATLAVDDGHGDNKKTLFIGLTFWDKSAEVAAEHLVKGQRIGVTGRLSQEEFTPKGSDKPTRKTHVTVIAFDFLDKPQGYEERPAGQERQQPAQRQQQPAQSPAGSDYDEEQDDIPF